MNQTETEKIEKALNRIDEGIIEISVTISDDDINAVIKDMMLRKPKKEVI
tara:strand:+ start:509 stop:658 length:150 start_codon:yes stop_codon:yes gene_type:complete